MDVFLEGLRRSLVHDLRTPLGTIVNYAAVLESHDGPRAEVQIYARRIRDKAMQTATMLGHLSSATELAARARPPVSADLPALLKKTLTEIGGLGSVVSVRGLNEPQTQDVDAAFLSFVWNSYLTLECDVCSEPPRDVELSVASTPDGYLLDLRVGPCPPSEGLPSDLARFLRDAGHGARPETCLGLRLAAAVAQLYGSALELRGRPGAGSGLRLRLPLPLAHGVAQQPERVSP